MGKRNFNRGMRSDKETASTLSRKLRGERLEDRRVLAVVTVDTPLDVVDFTDGVTSLREAIFATNTVPGADEIVFDFGHDGPETILLTEGELRISDSLTITGPAADLLTIDASGNDPTPEENNRDGTRVFNIDDFNLTNHLDVEISGVTLTGGDVPTSRSGSSGGAIHSEENLTLRSSILTDNAAFSGGGLSIIGYGQSSTLIFDSVITNNTSNSAGDGGGIFYRLRDSSQLTIRSTEVTDNTAIEGGGIGGWTNDESEVEILAATIDGNSAVDGGGGGINVIQFDSSKLTVRHSVVSGNSGLAGGGMRIDGRTDQAGGVEIHRTTFSENSTTANGGAIQFLGRDNTEVLVSASTFIGNSSGNDGGGIATNLRDDSQLSIESTTIADNSADFVGGGIHLVSTGNGLLSIESSTISGNTADATAGGIFLQPSSFQPASISHSTVTGNEATNAGGISLFRGTLEMDHTIVAGNINPISPDVHSRGGVINLSNSLIGFNVNTSLVEAPVGAPDANGNLIGGSTYGTIDPRLGPLQDNGGPTLTHALLLDSPAVNRGDLNAAAGVDGVPIYDQRGQDFGRIFSGRIDIGAYELQEISDLNLLVDTLVDESDGDYDRSGLSLREAIELANANPAIDTIRFDPILTAVAGPTPPTIVLTQGELRITDSVDIAGFGADQLVIDASGNDPTPAEDNGDGSRILLIGGGRGRLLDTTIKGMTLTGGDVGGYGGAIYSSARLALEDVVVTDNYSSLDGGGLWLASEATLDEVTVKNNGTGENGGGIRVWSAADVTIRNSAVMGNYALRSGGGLHSIRVATISIYDSTISSNVAQHTGGGLNLISDTTTIVRTDISFNVALEGGGIYTDGRSLLLEDSTIHGNRAEESGGGLSSVEATVEVIGGRWTENSTTGNQSRGGAIAATSSQISTEDTSFTGNGAGGQDSSGGAISANQSDVHVAHGLFRSNSSTRVGGAVESLSTDLAISGTLFEFNSVTGEGGAIYIDHGTSHIDEAHFRHNSSTDHGGAIAILSSNGIAQVEVHNSHFENNLATDTGGAISAFFGSDLKITQSLFESNSTELQFSYGGAIYTNGVRRFVISQSVLANNDSGGFGGAISSFGELLIDSSLLIGNSAQADGGGLYYLGGGRFGLFGRVESSSIVDNRSEESGGGIYVGKSTGDFSLVNSTVSENEAARGGGIYFVGNTRGIAAFGFNVLHSTIAYNSASSSSATGGIVADRSIVDLGHAVVFGNESDSQISDIGSSSSGSFVADYSLIGTIAPSTPVVGNNLLLGFDPRLEPLASNGTVLELPGGQSLLTHALDDFSPALDAGDPTLLQGGPGLPEFDQRGAPFARVSGDRIDLGAYEQQAEAGDLNADFDGDGATTGLDFLRMQRNWGTVEASHADGDATGDEDVDAHDLSVWNATYDGNAYHDTAEFEVEEPAQAIVDAQFAVYGAIVHQEELQRQSASSPSLAATIASSRSAPVERQEFDEFGHVVSQPRRSDNAVQSSGELDQLDGESYFDDSPFPWLADEVFDRL